MPTTTNFGWTTPADTDLVKDGAAAIRTLGNGIDTSLLDLKGGTTGQILSKNSNTDLDYTWVTPNVGDITEVQAGTGISVASGTGPIPVVTNTVATAFDAKADLVVGTGADTFAKLTVGANDTVLTADSSTATGLKWATPAAGGMTLIETLTLSGSTTTSSTIPGTYKHLYIVFKNVDMSNSDNCWIRLNGDTGNNYISAQIGLSNTTVQSRSPGAESKIYAFDVTDVSTELEKARGIIWIPRYTDTDGVFVNICSYGNDSTRKSKWVNAIYDCSAAISSITFGGDSFTFTTGTVYIYGVE